jgi:3-carboxy-cis,cis-muconate cycloisomerase
MAPNLAATIFAAQVQDHERSAGPWHAEWPTLPTLMLVTSGGLAAIVDIAEGLEVDAARMRSQSRRDAWADHGGSRHLCARR